jgi:hypothetical protein
MKKFLLAASLMLTAVSANATVTTFGFDFVNMADSAVGAAGHIGETGVQSKLTSIAPTSGSGVSVSASGAYDNTNAFAYLDAGNAGLGVCKTSNCAGNSDDNLGKNETLTLTFDKAVTFSSISFKDGGHGTTWDSSLSFLINGATVSFANLAGNGVLDSSEASILKTASSTWTFTNLNPDANNKQLYISAISGSVSPVPEAEEWAMMMLGLGMMGFVAKRKRALAA